MASACGDCYVCHIPNYYWLQEFPLKRYLNFLTILKEHSLEILAPILVGKTPNELKEAARKVEKLVREGFKDIAGVNFNYKQCYPIQFPSMGFISFVYAACLLAFAVCCFTTGADFGDSFVGLILFFIAAVITINIINSVNLFLDCC